MKTKIALIVVGALLLAGIQFPVHAEETVSIEEEALAEAPEQEEEAVVQASYGYGYAEPVSQIATRSGRLDTRPLTKTEIANLYQNARESSTAFSYDVQPHIGAPYAAGRASAANRQSALNYLNMYRQIAGLTPVVESEELSDQAQHGAVLLAAINQLTHYPEKPADMEEDFYQIAYGATTSSNLSAGYGRMEYGIEGCMRDHSGSNLTSLGHRRWFLNPDLLYIGLGEAQAVSGYGYGSYFAYTVFDRSNVSLDHDFVSWPSSGNFPIELLNSKLPWSISLNRNRYATPKLEELVVEIMNPAGNVETFSAANYMETPSTQDKYFNVNTGGYGEGPCIICNFGSNYADYIQPGVYQVRVTGLKSALTGEPVVIDYRIRMFYASDYAGKTAVTDIQYEAIGNFVERLYVKCLGRESEDEGKLDWTMLLADRDLSGAEVGRGFVFSEEYLNKNTSDGLFLDMLYDIYLDREADAGGKEDWGEMLSHGVSRLYVFRGFAESAEYSGICAQYGLERGTVTLTEGRDLNPGVTMFVYRLYEKALGREAEIEGLNDWAGKIARGEMTAETVAKNFFKSEEFLNKGLEDKEYIQVLYQTFMGREYDEEGLYYWEAYLTEGYTRDEVLEGFSRSEEFRQIMASYGL